MEAGIPVLSIDTKKKELIGNFKHPEQALANDSPRSHDHDFETFAEAEIVPHGICDIARNTGYLTVGSSIENAAKRAELTTTTTGLKVYVHINMNVYEAGRKTKDVYSSFSRS